MNAVKLVNVGWSLVERLKAELEPLRVQYIKMTIEWAIKDFHRLLEMKRKMKELDHLRKYANEVYYEGGRHDKVCSQYSDSIKALGQIITMNGRKYHVSSGSLNNNDYMAFKIDCALDLGIIGVLKFWESRGADGMRLISYDSALEISNQTHIRELNDAIESYRNESQGEVGTRCKYIHMRASLKSVQERGMEIVSKIHVEWFIDNAEKHFSSSLEKLAYRLMKKGLNLANLSFTTSHMDANISTTITDGKRTIRAFTIIASGEVQRPHYRYLINEVK